MTFREFLRGPEPTMIAAAGAGEMLLARFRIAVLALIILVPTWKFATGSDFTPAVLVSWVAMGCAIALYLYLRRHDYSPLIGFCSVSIDTGLVTLSLLIDLAARHTPLALVNNRGTFDLYFLIIVATSLRYDRRICLYAGSLSVAIYLGFIAIAYATPDLDASMWVERYGRFYLPDQISRVIFLVSASALSVVLVTRSAFLLELAVRDPLTRLYNRSFLQEHLSMSIEHARREQRSFCLAMLDVDHFKAVNDAYGHPAGDQVLRGFAASLRGNVRAVDLVARYGGEEFCIVFADVDLEQARVIVDTLRERLALQSFRVAGVREPLHVRFSAGVAQWREGDDGSGLLRVADERLLRAKAQGRDRVVAT